MRKSANMPQGSWKSSKGHSFPLVFSTTGEMGEECARYHARLCVASGHKEGRDLQYYGVMDRGKSLVCSPEGGTFMPDRL